MPELLTWHKIKGIPLKYAPHPASRGFNVGSMKDHSRSDKIGEQAWTPKQLLPRYLAFSVDQTVPQP